MPVKLVPPDLDRCQGEMVQRTPFALGGTHKRERCKLLPTVIVIEKVPGKDGQIGSMSLCPSCLSELDKQLGQQNFTIVKIKESARGQRQG